MQYDGAEARLRRPSDPNTAGLSRSLPPTRPLQFVNMTNTPVLNASSRRLIRSHVMKDYDKRVSADRRSIVVSEVYKQSAPWKKGLDGMHRWRVELAGNTHQNYKIKSSGTEAKSIAGVSRYATRASLPLSRRTSKLEETLEQPRKEGCNDFQITAKPKDKGKWVDSVDMLSGWPRSGVHGGVDDEILSITHQELRNTLSTYFGQQISIDQLLSPPVYKLGIANGQVDSFNTLPSQTPRSGFLVRHLKTRILASSLMMYARNHWFMLAFNDKALFLICLSHAAETFHLQQQIGRRECHEALRLRTEAIKLINERISNVEGDYPSDGTVGAVASMLSYEATHGQILSIRIHKSGLSQMISLRGGIRDGNFTPALLRLILWADLNTANALNTTPLYPPLSTYGPSITLTRTSHSNLLQNLTSKFDNTASLTLLPHPLTSALFKLRHLVGILALSQKTSARTASCTFNSLVFSDHVYAVQRTLMTLESEYTAGASQLPLAPQTSNLEVPPSSQTCNQEQTHENLSVAAPIATAGLVFVECILREVAPSAHIIGTLRSRLIASICGSQSIFNSNSHFKSDCESSFDSEERDAQKEGVHRLIAVFEMRGLLDVLFWVFAIGGTVAAVEGEEIGEKGWWVRLLKEVVKVLWGLEMRDKDVVLRGVVWPEGEGSTTRWKQRWRVVWDRVVAGETNVQGGKI